MDLALDLLRQFGSLNEIFAPQLSKLTLVHGIGISKYVQLQAIFEMSHHALKEQMQVKEILNSPKLLRDYFYLKLGNLTRGVFLVLFLDAQYKVVKTEEMFSGMLTQASIYP